MPRTIGSVSPETRRLLRPEDQQWLLRQEMDDLEIRPGQAWRQLFGARDEDIELGLPKGALQAIPALRRAVYGDETEGQPELGGQLVALRRQADPGARAIGAPAADPAWDRFFGAQQIAAARARAQGRGFRSEVLPGRLRIQERESGETFTPDELEAEATRGEALGAQPRSMLDLGRDPQWIRPLAAFRAMMRSR